MGRLGFCLATFALALTACKGDAAPTVTNPEWLRRPGAQDVSRAYPPLANALGLEGRATIDCTVNSQGVLHDCTAAAAPKGIGFDNAALSLAPLFRMKPRAVDGTPMEGGKIRVPIRFVLPPAPTWSSTPPPTPSPEALAVASKLVDELVPLRTLKAQRVAALTLWEKQSAGKVEPTALADAISALRQAYSQATPALDEAVARRLAVHLSIKDLNRWLAFTRSPASAAMRTRQTEITKELGVASYARRRATGKLAASRFCRARDCASSPNLAALLAAETVGEAVITAPEWSEQPKFLEMVRAHPDAAAGLGIEGFALLRCYADDLGLLSRCMTLVEAPRHLGFGAAALRLAPSFRLSMKMMGQGAAGESVDVPMRFAVPPPPALPAAPAGRDLALARETVFASGFTAFESDLVARLIAQVEADPDVSPDTRAEAASLLRTAASELADGDQAAYAAIFARTFTDAELTAIRDHLRAPEGWLNSGRDAAFNLAFAQIVSSILGPNDEAARALYCKTQDCTVPQPQTAPPPVKP